MSLVSFSARQFRCFSSVDLGFSPRLNIIEGKNASGKTSLLEAIFVLSRGRSFRTSHLDETVKLGNTGFELQGRVNRGPSDISVGVVRTSGHLEVRIANKPAENVSQLADILPVQVLDGHAHKLISSGPKFRRQLLDWGTFHVEPGFRGVWRGYMQALKQRNAALRANKPEHEISIWDLGLVTLGAKLHDLRRRYLDDFSPHAAQWASAALGSMDVEFAYRRGWPEGQDLLFALKSTIKRDRILRATSAGPHRADLLIKVGKRPANEILSRGQEKVLASVLLLAQADLYKQRTGLASSLLLDDLTAELDSEHVAALLRSIRHIDMQAIATTIDRLPRELYEEANVFHVEHEKLSVVT